MKRWFILSLAVVVLATLMTAPVRINGQGALVLEIEAPEVLQGRTTLLKMIGPEDITRATVSFDGHEAPLYRAEDGTWVGFLPASIVSERGAFEVTVNTWIGEEAGDTIKGTLTVLWGSFFYQNIAISGALADLLDPDMNRQEEETLTRLYSRYTPEKLWDGALQLPVGGEMISEFGGIRSYNDGILESRHTGTDFRAGTGESVYASGSGRVIFANHLPIHGNHIVIDHGLGVLTGYSHLSEILVVPGQRVLAGDVIGLVGATGRVQGAHMHFEVAVNGVWVDPQQFLSLTVPEAAGDLALGG